MSTVREYKTENTTIEAIDVKSTFSVKWLQKIGTIQDVVTSNTHWIRSII